MTETTKIVGTTTEVLQHYLTAKIDCLVVSGALAGARGSLVGLDLDKAFQVHLRDKPALPALAVQPADCLPVLRPFSQLCEPLPDGTIPAIEIAKMAVLGLVRWGAPKARFSGDTLRVDFGGHEGVIYMMGTSMDGGFWIDDASNTRVVRNLFGILNYLRSKHFAVGLEPGQFIPKTSASAPTIENTSLTPNS